MSHWSTTSWNEKVWQTTPPPSSNVKSLDVNFTYHDFIVLLFVYVLVTEHVAGTQHDQLASLLHETWDIFQYHLTSVHSSICWEWVWKPLCASDLSLIEGQNGPIEGEADWASWKNSHSRLHHTQCGTIWVHKCESPTQIDRNVCVKILALNVMLNVGGYGYKGKLFTLYCFQHFHLQWFLWPLCQQPDWSL